MLGRALEPLAHDPASNPRLYREQAEQLCEVEGVSVIFGGDMSSTRKAMLPVVKAHRALLFYPTLYEACRDAGFDARTHPIASQSTQEAEIAQMAAGAAEGCITAAPYVSMLGSERRAGRRSLRGHRFRGPAPADGAAREL